MKAPWQGIIGIPASVPERATAPGEERPASENWMLSLEEAQENIRLTARLLSENAEPVMDLRPVATLLERTLTAIFDAFDDREPRLDAARAAVSWVDEAITSLAPAVAIDPAIGFSIEHLRDARTALSAGAEKVPQAGARPRQPPADLRASIDWPELHSLVRPSIVPRLVMPAPPAPQVDRVVLPPRPTTFEELAKAVEALARRPAPIAAPAPAADVGPVEVPVERAGFVAEIRPPSTPEEFLRARVRHFFEEVSMLGVQREPTLEDRWRSCLTLEWRMFASIDAIAAMGPASIAMIEPLVMDSPSRNAASVFGSAIILGCIAGRDALAAAERIFYAFELSDPECGVAFSKALKLAPHPHLPFVMRRWLSEADPARRAIAIDVLGYRAIATPKELAHAVEDEPAVAAAALPYFARTWSPEFPRIVRVALQSSSLALRQSAWLAMALAGDPGTATALRAAMDREFALSAAVPLAIAGDAQDAAFLLARAQETQKSEYINAVGWAGAGGALAPLIALLREAKESDAQLAVASALERITGAKLTERTQVPPERVMVPDIPEPKLKDERPPRLTARVSGSRDTPGDGAPDIIEQPTLDPGRWSAFVKEHEAHFDPKARFRRGYLYTPLISLGELDHWKCTPGERRFLQRELATRTGDFARFDPHDFVRTQEKSLREWEPIARRVGQPGTWTTPTPRRP